jgi:hypothetical protein
MSRQVRMFRVFLPPAALQYHFGAPSAMQQYLAGTGLATKQHTLITQDTDRPKVTQDTDRLTSRH